MTLTQAQIEAVIKAGFIDASGMTDLDELHDVAYVALENEAPEVKAWEAQQDERLGPYDILIRGVPGAYFVQGTEGEMHGVYSTLEEAIRFSKREAINVADCVCVPIPPNELTRSDLHASERVTSSG